MLYRAALEELYGGGIGGYVRYSHGFFDRPVSQIRPVFSVDYGDPSDGKIVASWAGIVHKHRRRPGSHGIGDLAF